MDLVHPTAEQSELLRKLNNEDPNTKAKDVQYIKNWIRKEPHLPDDIDDDFLITFLRMCKYSLEKTKKKLDMYYTMRALVPEFFSNRDITREELRRIPKVTSFGVMPGLTPTGRRITVALSPLGDFDIQDTINFAKIVLMMGDIRINIERGVHDIYILDASILQLKNLSKVSIILLNKFFICVQEAYPVQIKEVHVINSTPLVSLAIKWAAKFLPDKLIKRIRVHESLESLHECVPKELLPEECGGTAGRMEEVTSKWMKTLEEWGKWFKEQEKLKADLGKKRANGTTYENLFGVEGSFKQLTVD